MHNTSIHATSIGVSLDTKSKVHFFRIFYRLLPHSVKHVCLEYLDYCHYVHTSMCHVYFHTVKAPNNSPHPPPPEIPPTLYARVLHVLLYMFYEFGDQYLSYDKAFVCLQLFTPYALLQILQ